MTSANVTLYRVFRGIKLILDDSQNCMCINRIDDKLYAIEKPEECTISVVWPDENEVHQTQYYGSLEKYLRRKTMKKEAQEESMRIWCEARDIVEAADPGIEGIHRTEAIKEKCKEIRACLKPSVD